jgi:hypothetical protein
MRLLLCCELQQKKVFETLFKSFKKQVYKFTQRFINRIIYYNIYPATGTI